MPDERAAGRWIAERCRDPRGAYRAVLDFIDAPDDGRQSLDLEAEHRG